MCAVAVLRRRRPQLRAITPMATAYALRLLVIPAIALTGFGKSLRGGDEGTFLTEAHALAHLPWSSGQWLPWNHQSFLHVIVFATQLKILNSPQGALRVTQVGISLLGALMMIAAVYDLAGPRASRLAAWLLALEPASIFFAELIHKDPLMEFASGLVVLGATKVWARPRPGGVAMMVAGGLIALATRNYVGYFLLACAVVVLLHAIVRQLSDEYKALPALLGVAVVLAVALPVVLSATSSQNLKGLAHSQQTNATSTSGNGQTNGNNLALEDVDFSTRSGLITGLPLRIRDLLLRPYPWQIADLNQSIGAIGSLVALACFLTLIRYAVIGRGEVLDRAGPILYPFLFLTIAYALAVGNAGTGFRYRTHLVTLGLSMLAVLREGVLQRRAETPVPSPIQPRQSGGDPSEAVRVPVLTVL